MAAFEAALFLLVIPACGSALAMLAGWLAYSDLRVRDDSQNPGPKSIGRFIVYPAVVATPIIYGFVLWFLSNRIAAQLDSGADAANPGIAVLFLWSAASFATVALVALAGQAWVARERMAQFVGADFPRVQSLIVLPELAAVFGLMIMFLTLGRIGAVLDGAAIAPARIDSVVLALQAFMVSSLALLVGVALSNQVETLAGRGYLRALVRGEIGVVAVFVTFIWAFLQVRSL